MRINRELKKKTANTGGSPPIVVQAPSGLSVSNISDTSATFSWNSVSGADSYVIEGGTGGSYSQWGTPSGNSFTYNSLSEQTTYNWRVKTVDGEDESGYANGSNFTTAAAPTGNFSMSLGSGMYFDVTDNGLSYRVPDVRRAGFDTSEIASPLPIGATMATGTGNDAQALRDAINLAKNSIEYQAGVEVAVYVPDGYYPINSYVRIDEDRIHIVGQSESGVVLDAAGFDMGSYKGILDFEGNGGSYSTNLFSQDISEGDTKLYCNNTSGWSVGQYLYLQQRYEPSWWIGNHAKTGGNQTIYGVHMSRVVEVSSDGGGAFIRIEKPIFFDLDKDQSYRAYNGNFITNCGISNLTLRQSQQATTQDNRPLLRAKWVAKLWVRNVTFDCPLSHYFDNDWLCDSVVEDCTFQDGWFRGFGGGRSYIGWWKATNCLMQRVTGTWGRHVAFQNFARGCVIKDSTFTGMDLNYHAEFPGHNIIENCIITDERQPVTKQGENNRDIYSQIMTTIPTEEPTSSALSACDNMNTVWGCDFQGTRHGGGWFDGGGMRDFTMAYNRLEYKGNSWQGNSWHDGESKEPAILYSVPSERNKYVRNEIFKDQTVSGVWAVSRRGTAHNEGNTPDVHLLSNTFYNHDASHRIRNSSGVTDSGNTWISSEAIPPNRPTPPISSLHSYQLANHSLGSSPGTSTQKNILMLYGSVSNDGVVPAPSNPYHQMRLGDTGNEGFSQFAASINSMTEGNFTFSITEAYDATFNINNLSNYDCIFLASSQKIWSSSERTAFVNFVNAGGGLVTFSDSALGGFYGDVGVQNTRGQDARNPLLENFGMQYYVDHGGPNVTTTTVPSSEVISGGQNRTWEGEGVSPIRIDSGAGSSQGNPRQVVAYNGNISHTQNVTYTGPICALAEATPGSGIVLAMFDRNFLWNNGAGSNYGRVDNQYVVERIFKRACGVI